LHNCLRHRWLICCIARDARAALPGSGAGGILGSGRALLLLPPCSLASPPKYDSHCPVILEIGSVACTLSPDRASALICIGRRIGVLPVHFLFYFSRQETKRHGEGAIFRRAD
jgi:hypothetical protein